MVAAFAAAYMSTVATQLNWGASYLVNDFYRRFISPKDTEKNYVLASQAATLFLMVASSVVTYYQDSISGAWQFLMAIGAGTGSVFILRWFWWRINAWSEISAMGASFIVSIYLQSGKLWTQMFPNETVPSLLFVWDPAIYTDAKIFAYTVLITVACSSIVWLAVTFLTPPEDRSVLLAFYRRVRPSPTLWGPIAREASEVRTKQDGLQNLGDWFAGCVMIYLTLFGVGKIIFGETALGIGFLVIAVLAGAWVYRDLSKRGWKFLDEPERPE